MRSPELAAITVFNAVYGGGISSKLFLNVRERLSLCYYTSSMIDRHKGVMYVISGIDFNKYDEVLGEILTQLEAVKEGEISPEELDGRKSRFVVSESRIDSAASMDAFYLGQAVDGLDYGLEEYGLLLKSYQGRS